MSTANGKHPSDDVPFQTPQKKQRSQYVAFEDIEDLDTDVAADAQALQLDDDDVSITVQISETANSLKRAVIEKFLESRNTSENPSDLVVALTSRDFRMPSEIPKMSESSEVFTEPFDICGTILPVKPIIGPNQEIVDWSFIHPTDANGKYIKKAWTKEGHVNYRGHFNFSFMFFRHLPSLFNRASAQKDKESLEEMASSIGQAASPDGSSWGWILTLKKPLLKEMLDYVIRDEKFMQAYEQGKRPVLHVTNCTFSYNRRIEVPQLQTMSPPVNKPGPRSKITWIGNYKDLGRDFATQQATQLTQDN